jgi:hypothetical protein
MGNHFVHRNALAVQTEHPFYHAGDMVRGSVFLNVVEPFASDGLRLAVCVCEVVLPLCDTRMKVEGTEIVHFTRDRSDGDGNSVTDVFAESLPRLQSQQVVCHMMMFDDTKAPISPPRRCLLAWRAW